MIPLAFALLIPLTVAPAAPAPAADEIRAAPAPSRTIWPSPRRSFGGEPVYEITRTHPFVAGGLGLMTSESLTNAWMLAGWNVTAGVEIPVRRSWSLVPRAHLGGATGTNTGSIHFARIAVDGRVPTRGGAYSEAGLGIGVLDSPVSVTDSLYQSHEEQRWSGVPFAQLVAGLRGNPEDGPAFMTELTAVLGLGAERPAELAVAVGVQF
jgi:hypothetical protein